MKKLINWSCRKVCGFFQVSKNISNELIVQLLPHNKLKQISYKALVEKKPNLEF